MRVPGLGTAVEPFGTTAFNVVTLGVANFAGIALDVVSFEVIPFVIAALGGRILLVGGFMGVST